MYYEEKVINGVLHWRGHPDDNWTPCTPQELTAKLEGKAAAPQPPAEAQPVAWMDPDTEDVIHDMRKTSWSTDYGVGGEKKARTYTTPLYAHPPPSAPVGDDPIDASDNAEYIEHCADRLERFGLRVTAGALRVIAHEHRTLAQPPAVPTWIGIDWAAGQQPTAVDDLNTWRAAFVAERATRYREGGMAIEQARIHAETDATLMGRTASQPQQPEEME